jgi:Xaa-Pro aminopeptidase
MTTTSRLDALRGQFGPHSIDTLLVSQLENRLYLSGFDGSSGFLLVSPRHAILATDFRYIEQAHQQAPLYTICKIQESWETWLPEVLSELNSRELGFEADGLSVSIYNQICKALLPEKSGVKLVPTSGLVETQRMVKDTAEIAAMREAIAISDAAMDHARQTIRCGMSEVEVAWSIEKYMREHGSQSVPFELIVASGPNSALPHAKPSKRPIQAGEPLVIDIGAQCHGYTSDLTRTLYLGQPNEIFRRVYGTVLQAQQKAVQEIRAGMEGRQADGLSRMVITQAGYGEAFGHSLGHGVGLATHELPRLSPNNTTLLQNGMTFTIEPGIYIPGWGGVRIEDTVILENNKVMVLSQAPNEVYE